MVMSLTPGEVTRFISEAPDKIVPGNKSKRYSNVKNLKRFLKQENLGY